MTKSKYRKSGWLLTVASAYTLVAACGDDAESTADAQVKPPYNFDAGTVVLPPDAGRNVDAGLQIDARSISGPPDAGVVVAPPDASPNAFDAGVTISPPDAGDAGRDAASDAARDASADAAPRTDAS